MAPYKRFEKETSEWYIARIPNKEDREKLLSLIGHDHFGFHSSDLMDAVMTTIFPARPWDAIVDKYKDELLDEPIIPNEYK